MGEEFTPSFFAVDFFCGAGGTTRGLIDAGGYVLAGIDKVSECAKTYTTNNINGDGSSARYIMKDIFEKNSEYEHGEQHEVIDELRQLIAPIKSKAPLLFSICAPCQPFTNMTRIKMTDERTEARSRDRGLLGQSLDYVEEFMPELVFCENVAGIQHQKFGGVWQNFSAGLEELGYIHGSAIVDTANYGVPQHRKRSIMLAVRKDCLAYHADKIDIPMKDANASFVTVREALRHFPSLVAGQTHETIPNHRCSNLSDLNKTRLNAVAPGASNKQFESLGLAPDCHVKLRSGAVKTGFTDTYTRMNPDKPAPTITTKCFSISNGRFGHFDEAQTRAISVREAAALQSFPDDYMFWGNSIAHTAKMVGNAVPPLVAEFFAEHLLSLISKP